MNEINDNICKKNTINEISFNELSDKEKKEESISDSFYVIINNDSPVTKKLDENELNNNSKNATGFIINIENDIKEEKINSNIKEVVLEDNIKPLSDEQVTNHTASLWKYNHIPQDDPEPHDEYKCLDISYSKGKVIGASVRGKKHKHEGTNRDDWFECENFEDWFIVAVSDGAGSKKFSRIGAKISCETVTSFIKKELIIQRDSYDKFLISLSKRFDDLEFSAACGYLADLLRKSVLEAIKKIEEAYNIRKEDIEYLKNINRELKVTDFACTLLISLIIPLEIDGKAETLIVSCQIGDGAIAAINTDTRFVESLKLLGEPDNGSFSGETDFITSSTMKDMNNLITRTRITRGHLNTILLMTDGVADDYFPNESEIKRLYLDLIANGIIDSSNLDLTINKKSISIIKKLPDVVLYPWINDPNVTIGINYVKRMQEVMKLSLEQLWENKEILGYSAITTKGFDEAKSKADMLKIWLDNYVERGSFDDRTLVIVKLH